MHRAVVNICLLAVLFFFVACRSNHSIDKTKKQKEDTITISVFKVDTGGYGYDILVNGHVFIHQDIIPAIGGYFTFSSYDDAYRTAKYAVEKMLRTHDLPGLTVKELDSLGVLNKKILDYQKKLLQKYK